ncbi:MAG TPA: hypothetical protein VGS08_00800 [Candidatus Saccharimonadales bacterium]|nr:hypothetical protein [Candidatus Saccharimonadales bacterium]
MLRTTNHLMQFSRDSLFLSIYESCKHRQHPIRDATALTQTVVSRLGIATNDDGIIDREDLVSIVAETLQRFDVIAAAVYNGIHSLNQT